MIIVCMFMILMHIIEDFHLQGIMANMKQKKWWEDEIKKVAEVPTYFTRDDDTGEYSEKVNYSDYEKRIKMSFKYRNDYTVALALHGFEWSMFIHIPLIVLYISIYGFSIYDMTWLWMSLLILVQGAIHSYIDDLKANRWAINLVQDQMMHLIQIMVSCILFTVMI